MTCADVRCLAASYADAELPEEMHERIQRHLLRCAACTEDFGSIEMAVRALKSTHTMPVVSEDYVRSALLRLAQELDVTTRLPPVPGQLVLGIGKD
jgi:hypothetical protein